MKTLTVLVLPLALCTCFEAESKGSTAAESDVPSVLVVNYPLRYFVERIAGEAVNAELPAPRDVDPAFWEPDAAAIARYQQADLILLNGADYAKWIARATLPTTKLVDPSQLFLEQLIREEGVVTHKHGPEGEHTHGAFAFTLWLDPTLAMEQAKVIRDALPGDFSEGYESLALDLEKLDSDLRAFASGDVPLLASHPVYQYLARRYQLDLRSVHWEPDTDPGEPEWKALARVLEDHTAQWMIWEGRPRQATARRLAEMGVQSLVFDPCGNVPEAGDWLSVMRKNVENLRRAFR